MNRIEERDLFLELLKQDYLKARIFNIFLTYHRGIENAITIDDFMSRHRLESRMSRRSFRKFYSEEIPVAYVNTEDRKGLYWPTESRDMKPIKDLRKKAMAMLVRIKRLEDQHRDLMEPEQLDISL